MLWNPVGLTPHSSTAVWAVGRVHSGQLAFLKLTLAFTLCRHPCPSTYGCSCLSPQGVEVSFNTSILMPGESSSPFLHRVPDWDVKTGSRQVLPAPRWAASALWVREGPKALVGAVWYRTTLRGRAQALVVMLIFLLPLLTLSGLQREPGMGSTAHRWDATWPWGDRTEAGPVCATPLLYQRCFFKLGETESRTKIPQSPWVPTVVSDADHMGLINRIIE